jgi:hypothetical protein
MSAPVIAKDHAVEIGVLSIAYPGRFSEKEMPLAKMRLPLNSACRALDGITAIAKILFANEVERYAQGEGAQLLDVTTTYGLFEAIVFLAERGNCDASDLGEEIVNEAKEVA